jgi:TRAP-type C4-dicarboxylate transport system substrate-binding protein
MKFVTKLALALTFVGALVGGSTTASAGTVTLKFVGSHGPTTGWAWPAYQRLGEATEKATEGRVKLQFYQPGQLVPFVQHLEAVRAGIIDMAAVVPGYYQNEFALSSIWNYMYTYYPSAEASAHMWFDLFDQYMSMDFEKLNLACPGGNGWPVMPYDVFTIDKPLKTVDDMKGLKLRSNSGAMNKIIEAGGGIPVFMGGGQVPDALSKGMLNGTPMSDHWGTAVKIWEYGKPGWWTVTGSFPQGVSAICVSDRKNTKWTKKVSAKDKEAFGALLQEFQLDLSRLVDQTSAVFLKTAADAGVTISEWPQSEKERLMEGWKPLIADAMDFAKKEGAPAKWMIDAMHEWLKENKGKY